MTSILKKIVSGTFWTVWVLIGLGILSWIIFWTIKINTYRPEPIPSVAVLITATTANITVMYSLLIYGIFTLAVYIILTIISLLIKYLKKRKNVKHS
jgi:hypothetical protein